VQALQKSGEDNYMKEFDWKSLCRELDIPDEPIEIICHYPYTDSFNYSI